MCVCVCVRACACVRVCVRFRAGRLRRVAEFCLLAAEPVGPARPSRPEPARPDMARPGPARPLRWRGWFAGLTAGRTGPAEPAGSRPAGRARWRWGRERSAGEEREERGGGRRRGGGRAKASRIPRGRTERPLALQVEGVRECFSRFGSLLASSADGQEYAATRIPADGAPRASAARRRLTARCRRAGRTYAHPRSGRGAAPGCS